MSVHEAIESHIFESSEKNIDFKNSIKMILNMFEMFYRFQKYPS